MCFSPNLFVCPDGLFARHLGNYAQQKSRTSLFTARSELREVMFLALSVTFLLYEISREPQPLNGFAPNSQGRRVWSLAQISLNVKVKGQGHHGLKTGVSVDISGAAERICVKFTRKTCLVPRSDEFEGQNRDG